MYNRYIPQADGSYRRDRVREPQRPAPPPPPPPEFCPEPQHPIPPPPPQPTQIPCQPPQQSAFGFLRQLLPSNLDTGDLLIVILLLLMAGDGKDGQSTALLTLALYLFL